MRGKMKIPYGGYGGEFGCAGRSIPVKITVKEP